ncbi:rod shape-determining protein [Actinomadura violacea]|uniref:Rod shape-determining protein n=1 Tax=Actinomadura violacea TaxID=2819934 RepID=A0ABS3S279_9ACTN|nr:rod shape-determining protein [Actinomadura violacea]MBO2462369.1 rod shape-determining protein [Actinomadura violacea]
MPLSSPWDAGAPGTGSPHGPRAALDLGSSRVRAGVPARELIIDRPASLPVPGGRRPPRPRGGDADHLAAGGDAPRLRPIRHGMVADSRACAHLARRTLLEATGAARPREVLLAVPAAAGGVDRQRAVAAVRAAAGCPVRLADAPLAAVAGAGRPIGDPLAQLVMDIGAEIIEMAVIVDGRVEHARSVQYLPDRVPGRARPRIPESVRDRSADELRRMLADLPARRRGPVRARGLLLTGGGALLPSLPGWLTTRLAMPVQIAPDPARATIRGLARLCLAPAAVRAAAAPRVH